MKNCVFSFKDLAINTFHATWLSSRCEGSCVGEETPRTAKHVQYISRVLQDSYCYEHYDIVGCIFLFLVFFMKK